MMSFYGSGLPVQEDAMSRITLDIPDDSLLALKVSPDKAGEEP